ATWQQSLSGTETGLVGYWAFDEGPGSATTADLSNNNNAGTLMNFDLNTSWAGPGAPLQATGGATTFGYTALQPVLSGSFTHHSNGQLSFSYQERYAPSKVRCRVYGADRSVLLQQELQVGLGWNYLDLDVSTLANGADYYVLEVWNARGEKGYLRFR
ncbi:MAG: hypothetical protein KDD14_24775, partial [Saprospiraceae bacterium]|nr:hypothetical protein [Saprospiraceae bacterium]